MVRYFYRIFGEFGKKYGNGESSVKIPNWDRLEVADVNGKGYIWVVFVNASTYYNSRRMPMRAVLTADIVNSTKLDPATEKELVKELSKILRLYKFEFYRGDSFQVYIKEPQKAMEVALLCRIAAITVAGGPQESPLSDIRISIGLGAVKSPVKALATATRLDGRGS